MLKENPVAVVMPYLDKSTKSAELTLRDVTWVSEYLIEELIDTEKFIIPPRERMHEILNEHKINQSGLVDTSTGVSIGNWIGAQYMIVGSVTGLSAKESGIDIGVNVDKGSSSDTSASTSKQGVNLDGSKYTVIANITLRVIDLERGLYVVATHGEGKSARTHFDFSLHKDVVNYFGENGFNIPPQETPADDSGNTTTPQTTTPQENSSDNSGNTTTPQTTTPQENSSDNSGNTTTPQENSSDNSGNTTTPQTTTPQENSSDNSGNNQTADIPIDGSSDDSSSYTPSTNTGNQGTGNDQIDVDENGDPVGEKSVGTVDTEEFIPLVLYFDEGEGGNTSSSRLINVKFGMGSRGFGEEQVHNALRKAVIDAIYNKEYGLIAKLNGTAKKRKI